MAAWDDQHVAGREAVVVEADIGLVGANNGAYPSPAAFTLNGTVCSTTYSS